ncbi:hypothetical protein JVT61DRAFT_6110 [Boletus reticuloceps]|uniref:Uncharacterized protein n=1 Tax=Boletus reticuloceps TaxID=495285 RepID=A0A8I2YL63_9AGAM|nr:hypothetical protein JVT61DRAFT_6110 [Boletus reticuloceps]
MLENFSRTVRNYVPTSIPVPTAAPSPPRVSMPISFGNFMGHSPTHSSERESLTGTPPSERRRVRRSSGQHFSRSRASVVGSPEVQTSIPGRLVMNVRYRRVLLLGYSSGFQMCDCNNLAPVPEVLNLSAPS